MSIDGGDAAPDTAEEPYGDSTHQGCYIFQPPQCVNGDIDERPKKRRKTSESKNEEEDGCEFLGLLGGQETNIAVQGRADAFELFWAPQQAKINELIAYVDKDSLRHIVHFVRDVDSSGGTKLASERPWVSTAKKSGIPEVETRNSRLPTGLVIVGKDSNLQTRMLDRWRDDQIGHSAEHVIQLQSSQARNITSALKSIVKSAISSLEGQDGYQNYLSKHKKLVSMKFDLELLQHYAVEKGIVKFVISLLDVESFDPDTLSDLVAILQSWTDRVQFVLLIGITTTVELFEARLPKSTIRLMAPKIFNLVSDQSDRLLEMFLAAQNNPETVLWFGSATASVFLDKSKDQDSSPESFGRMIKYAWMSHFFANPLSLLLASTVELGKDTTAVLCKAIRNTPSFMEHVEQLLNNDAAAAAKKLLVDDAELLEATMEAISEGRMLMSKHYECIALVRGLLAAVQRHPLGSGSDTTTEYDKFVTTTLKPGNMFRATIRSLAGPQGAEEILEDLGLAEILESIPPEPFEVFLNSLESADLPLLDIRVISKIKTRLTALLKKIRGVPAQNGFDPHRPLGSAPPIPLLAEYRALLTSCLTALISTLHSSLIDPRTLFLREAFIYDLKNPLSQSFTPTSRSVIERALDHPTDYLSCECCLDEGAHQNLPPTSILWKLWCEAGGIVNVRDLWEAFIAILLPQAQDEDEDEVGDGESVDGKKDERMALALFYRSLAELKMLGFVKQSKRKPGVECLEKRVWRGL